MTATSVSGKVGDRLIVEPGALQQSALAGNMASMLRAVSTSLSRMGTITEVVSGGRYRVRWDDGSESVFKPDGKEFEIISK